MLPRTLLRALTIAGLVSCSGAQTEPNPDTGVASATTSASTNEAPRPAPRSGTAPKAPVALSEYFRIARVSMLSFSADEKNLAFMSDEGGRPDVWVRPIAGGGAAQVTHSEGFVHSFAFAPKGDALAFEVDNGGDELPHLYLTNAKGNAPRDIVPDLPKGRRTQFVQWATDGKSLLYLSSARDEKYMDLYEYDLKNKKPALLWKSSQSIAFALATRDKKRFVVVETKSDSDSDLYLVERDKPEEKTLLTKHDGDVLYNAATFSFDGKKLYYTSDKTGEFSSLYSMDLPGGKEEVVEKASWDVETAGVSSTGRYRFVATNADGSPKLTVTEVKTGKEIALPAPPAGGAWDPVDSTRSGPQNLGFSPSDRYLGVVLRSDVTAPAPWVIDLKDGTATPVANPMPPSLGQRKMVSAKSVRIRSFDGKEVPAFLYAPAGDGPFPALIDVHGGPTAQSRRVFSRFDQYLVSKGYVVLVPNVRGSTGYGKTWTKLDNLDLGGGPLKDVVACKQYLVTEAHVDRDRVVVMGGSYGGYMALAAAAFTPTEFTALVDYFGVSDLKTLVESFPPYWMAFASYIYKKFGDPKKPEDAKYQHDRSPLNFAEKIVRPLLVVQGEKDARVKADQSERIVAELKKRSVPVHYLLLPGEGHGFSKNENYQRVLELTDRFLDHYVFGDASVKVDEK